MQVKLGAIILVLVGTILLLSNLDFVSLGEVKKIMATWWPLALIAGGLYQIFKKR